MHARVRVVTLAIGCVAVTATHALAQTRQQPPSSAGFEVHEATITELQTALATGRVTSVQLVDAYLARIAAYNHGGPALNAIVHLSATARAEAATLDAERARSGSRGPLHGIPILLKDNYDTGDMPTTASTMALAGHIPPRDGFQVKKLRDAGAIVLGKTNLHELAAGILTISSLGGQTRNPYDPTRNPGGSSGGTGAAIAASFAALGWGTDTCGSIRIPAAHNALYGLRPTKGLSSISGIIPLSHTQDVAGPLARTVTDLAIGLDATIGYDATDSATHVLRDRNPHSFVQSLRTDALRGVRIGVLASYFGDDPEEREASDIILVALERMKQAGATIIDLAIPQLNELIANTSTIDYELRDDLRRYLAASPRAPVTSLGEILERGLYHPALEATLRRRNATVAHDTSHARLHQRRAALHDAMHNLMVEQRLDAIAYPPVRRKAAPIGEQQRGANCQLSASTGMPALSVPAGFTADGLPIGLELLGRRFDDTRLVAMAYGYEQTARPRRPPQTTPPLPPRPVAR